MITVPWATILDAAAAAAALLPQPAGALASLSIAIARALTESGCTVDGCPAHVAEALQPADIPTGERGLAALQRAEARARGLDGEASLAFVERVLDEAEAS